MQPLDRAAAQTRMGVRVCLATTEARPHIRTLLDREGSGRGCVVLLPVTPDERAVEVSLPGGWNISPRLAQALQGVPGVERVEEG